MSTLSLVQLGVGGVGSALLGQYLALEARASSGLRLAALADSRAAVVSEQGISASDAEALLALKTGGGSLAAAEGSISNAALGDWLTSRTEPTIVVDTTASDATLPLLLSAAQAGCGIVLANKRPLSGSQDTWDALTARGLLRYEATVGAGLPVIYSLDYLLRTGDEVLAVEGMLSGTLGFLLSRLEEGDSYSSAVRLAREQGYTEPDPRDDLGGMDVARKALILARTLGLRMELEDIAVEALYPPDLRDLSVPEFLDRASELDAHYGGRQQAAAERGKTLRYLARVTRDGVTIGLQSVPQHSPFGSLKGPDNLVVLSSRRYTSPMRLCGPGAGTPVTAAGVLRDILDLAQAMRARLADGQL